MSMRVAHVISTPDGIGGAENVVRALVRGGLERGDEVRLLNPFAQASHREGSIAEGLPAGLYEPKACSRIWQLPALHRWLSERLLQYAPQMVHTHLFHAQVAVASVRRGSDKRLLTHHHGSLVHETGRAYEKKLDRITGVRFDRIVAVSDAVREFLVDGYGYSPSQIGVIRNGWEGTPSLQTAREPNGSILCVANFGAQKGHEVLITAFAAVAREVADARLVLVGDGELMPRIRSLVETKGLTERVKFTGRVDDVWPYLASASLFVLPSLYESLGIAVLEAMAAGLPVVGSRVGGVPELVRDGVTGVLVPPNDPGTLADAIVGLLQDTGRATRLGNAGKAAAQEYRMERMVESYLDLYDELIEHEPG